MLEAKLEIAKKLSAKRNKRFMLLGAALIVFVGLVIYVLSFVDLSPSNEGSLKALNVDETIAPSTLNIPAIEPASEKFDTREDFIQALKDYETELEPQLGLYDLKAWGADTDKKIADLKEEALSNFAAAKYERANKEIKELQALAENTLIKVRQEFDDSYNKAKQFFANDDYENAKYHIDKALLIDPVSAAAISLQKNIMDLPKLLNLLEKIKISDIENNLRKELQLLTEALKIAPERQSLSERREEILKIILEEEFSAHILASQNSLTMGDFAEARQYLAKASKIYPDRIEIAVVEKELAERENDMRVKVELSRAQEAIKKDNWQQAFEAYKMAEKIAPNNQEIVEGLRISSEILNLKDALENFASAPYKLTSDIVKSQARANIEASQNYHSFSFSLKKLTTDLARLIDKMNIKVAINIVSDNQTYIIVRGVGKIGTTSQKQIKLKPGNYIFEGSRSGYKSKRVKFLIPYDDTYLNAPLAVEVICDERI